jgi:small basic protein (TIGR04137 family)
MSMDKSLKKGGGLTRARNVLTRAERLAALQIDERWTPEQGVFNLPKTKFRQLPPGGAGPARAPPPARSRRASRARRGPRRPRTVDAAAGSRQSVGTWSMAAARSKSAEVRPPSVRVASSTRTSR